MLTVRKTGGFVLKYLRLVIQTSLNLSLLYHFTPETT